MTLDATINIIRAIMPFEQVDVAMVLGSGLGGFADQIDGVSIDYSELPVFPDSSVSGHAANLVLGTVGNARVAILGGRVHYYEKGQADAMRGPLETIAALGAKQLLLTNAAGSVRNGLGPGDLMLISDHINFAGTNPLIGEETDRRFVPLTDAYDDDIANGLKTAAEQSGVELQSGVYTWFSGPSFETPAEIRATQNLGGDAVGMSTVPEVILGRFLGLKIGAISSITNMGAGLSDENISHEHTKAMAPVGAAKLTKLLKRYLENLVS
ncbi:MAG: purine-nucleoside phosphorylase [Rhizobiaceae bacterium]